MVTVIGYHASHEQHPPSRLLRDVRLAEEAGFGAISSSDHLSPWSERQGESGFAWSWLGAAMHVTSLPFGVVNAPGQRYHPAIIAQAVATLLEMFPDRLWVAMGSGEASNEHVTGDRWPEKPVRNERLLECVEVTRALLRGEEVSLDGHVRVDRARLWTLPARVPPIVGAALSVETARWCGGWADGLITVNQPPDRLGRIIDAFRDGGGEGKPVHLQVKVAWAPDEEEALAAAHDQWRTNIFDSTLAADLERVEQFEEAARHVRPEDMRTSVLVTSDLGRLTGWLGEILDAGADDLYVHHVPKEQGPFIDAFGAKVLPELVS
ncbi:MAG TPA: TIGR03885 family FMN-dependent LLM class oxidoreductase [Acidimicrobiales bacterium]|nr:TIGR03885 family FMN-dependent LLM class oxidoreductase [Acidimicrobiales bacterium]